MHKGQQDQVIYIFDKNIKIWGIFPLKFSLFERNS